MLKCNCFVSDKLLHKPCLKSEFEIDKRGEGNSNDLSLSTIVSRGPEVDGA